MAPSSSTSQLQKNMDSSTIRQPANPSRCHWYSSCSSQFHSNSILPTCLPSQPQKSRPEEQLALEMAYEFGLDVFPNEAEQQIGKLHFGPQERSEQREESKNKPTNDQVRNREGVNPSLSSQQKTDWVLYEHCSSSCSPPQMNHALKAYLGTALPKTQGVKIPARQHG